MVDKWISHSELFGSKFILKITLIKMESLPECASAHDFHDSKSEFLHFCSENIKIKIYITTTQDDTIVKSMQTDWFALGFVDWCASAD